MGTEKKNRATKTQTYTRRFFGESGFIPEHTKWHCFYVAISFARELSQYWCLVPSMWYGHNKRYAISCGGSYSGFRERCRCLPGFRSDPKSKITPEHETDLCVEPGYRTKDDHGDRNDEPLRDKHDAPEFSVLGRSLWNQIHRERCRKDEAEHRKREERARYRRQIVREYGRVECVPSDKEREPSYGKKDERMGRQRPKPLYLK